MFRSLYERSKLGFALVWIGIYCVLQSLANPINALIGIDYSASFCLAALQTAVILVFVRRNHLAVEFGLCRTTLPPRRFLFYVPLAVLASAPLWNGAAVNYSPAAAVFRICTMLCVGFLEEIIFRGFLFRAMLRDNVRAAVAVSSITFGLGHLINLANGSGAGLLETLCQVGYAVAIGFLFVIIVWRGGSLIPCIVTHAAINSLSTFGNEAGVTAAWQITQSAVIAAVALLYALYLNKSLQNKPGSDGQPLPHGPAPEPNGRRTPG